MLNPNAKKWVDALRSGEYKQGYNYLKLDGSFCCLGVLCQLAQDSGVQSAWPKEMYTGTLPHTVADWAGLQSVNPRFGGQKLEHLNDDRNHTFSQIADAIELHADELFEQPSADTSTSESV